MMSNSDTQAKTEVTGTGRKTWTASIKEVESLLKLAQQYKALVVKVGDIELHMSPVNFLPQTMTNLDPTYESAQDIKQRVEKLLEEEEDVLFHSV